MKRIFKGLLGAITLFMSVNAFADIYDYTGTFSGKNKYGNNIYLTSVAFDINENEFDVFAILETSSNNCIGRVELVGRSLNNSLLLKPYQATTKEELACTVGVKKVGKKMNFFASEGCSYFHGAQCTFDAGSLKRDK